MTILVKMDNLAEIQQSPGKNSIDMAKEPLRKWSFGRTFTSVRGIRWNLTWIFTMLLRFGQNRHSLRASFCYLNSNISQSHGNFRQIFYFFPDSPFSSTCLLYQGAPLTTFCRVAIFAIFAIVCISGHNWKNCPLRRGDRCLYLSGTMIKCSLMIGLQC